MKITAIVVLFLVLLQCSFALEFVPRLVNVENIGQNRNKASPVSWLITKHQASVRRKAADNDTFGSGHFCGGSLIAPSVVLSAAHCFVNYTTDGEFLPSEDFRVVLGSYYRMTHGPATLVFDIKELVFPGNTFNTSTYNKDIALIFLNASVPSNHPTVKIIDLNSGPISDNSVCQVSGWANTAEIYQYNILMTADVPIVDYKKCGISMNHRDELITESIFCATSKQGSHISCTGDFGSPLVCNGVQAGIVSWGIGCSEPLFPGVYTNVSYYLPWIKNQLRMRKFSVRKSSDVILRGSGFFVALVMVALKMFETSLVSE